MAPPSGPVEHAPGLVRFGRAMCLGIVCFVVGAMFVASGSVQTFAEGAVAAGFGWAVLGAVGRLLTRVHWREVIGVAAIAMFLGSIFEGVRLPPRRWP